jgi:hypothetical protein
MTRVASVVSIEPSKKPRKALICTSRSSAVPDPECLSNSRLAYRNSIEKAATRNPWRKPIALDIDPRSK